MLKIVQPLPSDSHTPIPFNICCCDNSRLGKKIIGINYNLRPTIRIGWLIYIHIILSFNKSKP